MKTMLTRYGAAPCYIYRGTGHDTSGLMDGCDCGQKWCPGKPNTPRRGRRRPPREVEQKAA